MSNTENKEKVELCGNGCCPHCLFDNSNKTVALVEDDQMIILTEDHIQAFITELRKRGYVK